MFFVIMFANTKRNIILLLFKDVHENLFKRSKNIFFKNIFGKIAKNNGKVILELSQILDRQTLDTINLRLIDIGYNQR